MNVGDYIWRFDDHRRVYPPREKGQIWSHGGPIYREHWVKIEIAGETSRSWIVGRGSGQYKVPKKGKHDGYAFKEFEVNDDCYIHEHRHKIARQIEVINDAATLRLVADAIGYEG